MQLNNLLFSRLKRFASTPVLPYSNTLGDRSAIPVEKELVHIPIIGYEVMEERARFTVSFNHVTIAYLFGKCKLNNFLLLYATPNISPTKRQQYYIFEYI